MLSFKGTTEQRVAEIHTEWEEEGGIIKCSVVVAVPILISKVEKHHETRKSKREWSRKGMDDDDGSWAVFFFFALYFTSLTVPCFWWFSLYPCGSLRNFASSWTPFVFPLFRKRWLFWERKRDEKVQSINCLCLLSSLVFPLVVFSSTQYGQVSMHASQFIPFVYVFSIWFSETLYVFSCFWGPSLDFLGWEWPTG